MNSPNIPIVACNCRITTPVDYDNTNEPDERKVDLQVQGSTIHLCNPNGAAYVAIRLKREQNRLGLQDHFRTAREIVALTMDPDYEPVGLSADMVCQYFFPVSMKNTE